MKVMQNTIFHAPFPLQITATACGTQRERVDPGVSQAVLGLFGALLVICQMLGWATPVSAQTLIGNASARSVHSLNGQWAVIIDPYSTGTLRFQSDPRNDGFWEDRIAQEPHELVEYRFDDAQTLAVPGDWNSQADELFLYEGPLWYRKTFSHTPGTGTRQFLRFGGVNRRATVWLNGEEIGGTRIGFVPFEMEVTDLLKEHDNILVVRVDNTRDQFGVPALLTDWWNYGGITRRVDLLETPATFVRDAHVQLDGQVATGWVQLDGEQAAGTSVVVQIGEHRVEITTDEQGRGEYEIDATGLDRWSPESPSLHEFSVRTQGDTFVDRVGLRTIEVSGDKILLNGVRVFLRGICIHEEVPYGDGRAWSEEHAKVLIGWAKELGCNFVRLAHYTHNEAMVRAAEEAGMMIWAEIPVYWKLEYEHPQTLADAKQHLSTMIARDHNRAGIVIWSIGNETREEESSTIFRTELAKEARRLDNTRLLSAALLARQERSSPGNGKPGSAGARLNRLVIDDPFAELVDLLAINQYIGWYHDRPDEIGVVEVVRTQNKPVFISEFGAGALAGYRGDQEHRWTEEYQAWLFETTLSWAEGIEGIAGVSPWILKDFRSPRRQLPGIQDFWNRKGVVSERGVRKLAWQVLADFYTKWEQTPPGE